MLLTFAAASAVSAQREPVPVAPPLSPAFIGRSAVASALPRLRRSQKVAPIWTVKEINWSADGKTKIPLLVESLTADTEPVKEQVKIVSASLDPNSGVFTVQVTNESDAAMEKPGYVYVQVVESKSKLGISLSDGGKFKSHVVLTVLFTDIGTFGKIGGHQSKSVVFDLKKYVPAGKSIDILGIGKANPVGEGKSLAVECGLIIGDWPAGN